MAPTLLETVDAGLATAARAVWGTPLVAALVITGLFLTARLGWLQIRGFLHAFEILGGRFDRPGDAGEISHFQALSAALSATVGLGNIAGVAIAIATGGPGAMFWMWICGFLGMATKATSCGLATMYRRIEPNGRVLGGPMHYIELGLGRKWRPLALVFAAFVTIGSFGIGNMFQANQVAAALDGAFGIPTAATGVAMAALIAAVILGGIRRIGAVAARLVPAMVLIYLGGAVIILAVNAGEIPGLFALIISNAFTGSAVAGGAVGEVIRQGFRRGTFSNEAGLGSAPIAHAAARTGEPIREGFVALLEPFIDTIVICTMTGLVILSTGAWKPLGNVETPAADGTAVVRWSEMARPRVGDVVELRTGATVLGEALITQIDAETGLLAWPVGVAPVAGADIRLRGGVSLTTAAFDSVLRGFGSLFVSLAVALFAFSTMLSWSYYGEQGARCLGGARAVTPYRAVFVAAVIVGSTWGLDPVVNFSDICIGLMAIPNLTALWLLAGRVRVAIDDYLERLRAGTFETAT